MAEKLHDRQARRAMLEITANYEIAALTAVGRLIPAEPAALMAMLVPYPRSPWRRSRSGRASAT
jgi:hypothetical protein